MSASWKQSAVSFWIIRPLPDMLPTTKQSRRFGALGCMLCKLRATLLLGRGGRVQGCGRTFVRRGGRCTDSRQACEVISDAGRR
jgi:hypothetical protein